MYINLVSCLIDCEGVGLSCIGIIIYLNCIIFNLSRGKIISGGLSLFNII